MPLCTFAENYLMLGVTPVDLPPRKNSGVLAEARFS